MSMFVCLSHSCLSTSIFSKSHVQSASNLLCMLPMVPDYKRRVECMAEFRTRLNRRQAIGTSLQKIWKSHSIPISTQIRLMKALVWIPDNSRLSPTENGKSNITFRAIVQITPPHETRQDCRACLSTAAAATQNMST